MKALTDRQLATMSCERCGCTQLAACHTIGGPCAWSADFAARGRAICTACVRKPKGKTRIERPRRRPVAA